MSPTPVSLLDRLRQHPADAQSWQHLVDLYTPFIRGCFRRLGLQEADVDDVVQEVLLAVVEELPTFERRGPGSFRCWLRDVPRKRLLRLVQSPWRQRARTGEAELARLIEELGSADSDLTRFWDQEHDRHMVQKGLKLIEQEFAAATIQAFHLLVLGNQPAVDVAAVLGLTDNAVWIAKSRVLRRLREVVRGLIN